MIKNNKLIICTVAILLIITLSAPKFINKFNQTKSKKTATNSENINETMYEKKQITGDIYQIMIPAVISYNGVACKANLILDTIRPITMIDSKLSMALGITTVIKRGKELNTKLDYIQIGPFIEKDFEITSGEISTANINNEYGSLGLNFLLKHNFAIDYNRKVIVWDK